MFADPMVAIVEGAAIERSAIVALMFALKQRMVDDPVKASVVIVSGVPLRFANPLFRPDCRHRR